MSLNAMRSCRRVFGRSNGLEHMEPLVLPSGGAMYASLVPITGESSVPSTALPSAPAVPSTSDNMYVVVVQPPGSGQDVPSSALVNPPLPPPVTILSSPAVIVPPPGSGQDVPSSALVNPPLPPPVTILSSPAVIVQPPGSGQDVPSSALINPPLPPPVTILSSPAVVLPTVESVRSTTVSATLSSSAAIPTASASTPSSSHLGVLSPTFGPGTLSAKAPVLDNVLGALDVFPVTSRPKVGPRT